jgi:hypothetical protein
MSNLDIASVAVGVIAGLALERRSGFGSSLVGGLALGAAGGLLSWGSKRSDVGTPLALVGIGIAVGASVSSLSSKPASAKGWLSPAPAAPAQSAPPIERLPVVFWTPMQPVNGSYTLIPGLRYRGVASVSVNYSKAQVMSYLSSTGWSGVVAYDVGDALPLDWPAESTGALEPGRRWIRVEAQRTGTSATIAAEPSVLFIKLPIRIANVWTAP